MTKKLIATLLLTSLLTACATPYQSTGLRGGYSDTQLSDNTFQVYFRGNGLTSQHRSNDFALLHASQLTLDHGFNYFTLSDAKTYDTTSTYTTPKTTTYYPGSTVPSIYGGGAMTSISTGGSTETVNHPHSVGIITCYKTKPTSADGVVYDAKLIFNSLSQKYGVNGYTKVMQRQA